MNRKALIFFILLLCAATTAFAQTSQPTGLFTVDQVAGCAPLTVNVTAPTCDPTKPCDMDYEGNSNFQSLVFTHTYTQPGTYTLRVLFQTIGFETITITVYPNIQPAFDVYTCGNNEVQVKVTDTNYNSYIINYNDGSPDVPVPSGTGAKDSHTYASSGPKNITVRGRKTGAADNCNALTQPVEALTTLPAPTINRLTVTAADEIQLDFTNRQFIIYKLEIATNTAGPFQQLQQVYNSTTATVKNLRTDDNYYCFRLGAFDPCNNTTAYSNTICSANFDLTTLSDLNKLTWTTSQTNVTGYSLTKSNAGAIPVAAPATGYDDTQVVCNTEYCYQLTTDYGSGIQSVSLEKCGKAFSSKVPSVVENISASVVNNNAVALQWTQDPAFAAAEYTVVKSVNGAFTTLGTNSAPTITDEAYAPETVSCYKVSYKDACNNQSPSSIEVCPIQLTASLNADNSVALSWTAYNGWKNGVANYRVEKFDDQGQLLAAFDAGTSLTLFDDAEDLVHQVYQYRITATAVDAGLAPSVSNTVTVIKEPNLFYPTAFTPNGDGLNDVFNVFGQYTAQFEFKIFNRWGELLFITNDFNQGWDGTYKGNIMPEGTYVFRAEITDFINRTSDRSGTIVLLRKR